LASSSTPIAAAPVDPRAIVVGVEAEELLVEWRLVEVTNEASEHGAHVSALADS
jgi:hypothetical protein